MEWWERLRSGDAGHTHPESFPASAQRESEDTMPCGPDWYYPTAVLQLIHFLGELPAEMALSCSFMVGEEQQKK